MNVRNVTVQARRAGGFGPMAARNVARLEARRKPVADQAPRLPHAEAVGTSDRTSA